MPTDAELLRAYAEEKSEAAFGELVRRQVNLVYSIAVRQCGGDAHLAEDVAQRVFTDLARRARSFSGYTELGGWLFRRAQFVASDIVRAEHRRRAREQEAHAMQEISRPTVGDADWQKLAPVLDQAIGELPERDRDAVVLRFFEGRPFAEIGATLRLTEDAARMRVERALDRSRTALERRGIASTTAALGVALANQAAVAVPAGIAASVTGAALAGASGGVAAGGTIFAMSKIKIGIVSAIVIAATVPAIVEVRANRERSAEAAALRMGGGDLAALKKENKQLGEELARLTANQPSADELGRLRARVATMQKRPAGVTDENLKPAASWTNRGWATPEDALETTMWTSQVGDPEPLIRNMRWIGDAGAPAEAAFAQLPEAWRTHYGTADRLLGEICFGSRGKENDDLMRKNYGTVLAYRVIDVTVDRKRDGMQVRYWEQMASGHEREKGATFSPHAGQFGFSENRWSEGLWQSMVDQIDPATGAFRPRTLVPMDPETGRPVR
ncbi:MAG: sigma-70 family RNA polymerase sigma factor [Opitutaceae bacterium]